MNAVVKYILDVTGEKGLRDTLRPNVTKAGCFKAIRMGLGIVLLASMLWVILGFFTSEYVESTWLGDRYDGLTQEQIQESTRFMP